MYGTKIEQIGLQNTTRSITYRTCGSNNNKIANRLNNIEQITLRSHYEWIILRADEIRN